MADVQWIKIATQIFDNRKIKQIEKMPEGDAIIVVWFKLLCLAGTSNKNGMIFFTDEIPYTEEMLATEFGMEQQQRFNVLRLALNTFERFKMIEIIDNIFYISSWEKYQNTQALEKIREQTRERVARHRENQKLLTCNVTVTENVTQCNAIDKEEEIEKDKDNKYSVCFEAAWNEYPRKKEKAKAYSCYKTRLKDGHSEEEILQAIKNYANDCKINHTEDRYIKLCATFLGPNTPFIDYLDKNYKPAQQQANKAQPKSTNKFNQFPQRTYDYQALEKALVNKQRSEEDE